MKYQPASHSGLQAGLGVKTADSAPLAPPKGNLPFGFPGRCEAPIYEQFLTELAKRRGRRLRFTGELGKAPAHHVGGVHGGGNAGDGQGEADMSYVDQVSRAVAAS